MGVRGRGPRFLEDRTIYGNTNATIEVNVKSAVRGLSTLTLDEAVMFVAAGEVGGDV